MLVALAVSMLVQTGIAPHSPLGDQVQRPPHLQAAYEADPSRFLPPRWAQQPQMEYPRRALDAGVSGYASISCIVNEVGEARLCQIESEDPSGFGFGDAVMATRPQLLFNPATIDGVPVESVVTFGTPFQLLPTFKPSPKLAETLRVIGAVGYWTAVCRDYVDPTEIQTWENLPTEDQEGFDDLPPFEQMFVQAYESGKTAVPRAAVTQPYCERALRAVRDDLDRSGAKDRLPQLLATERLEP